MIRTVIADDEVLVRMGLRTMIDWEAHGYEIVAEAGDGEKVLELCRKHQVDLVITDIKMPKLDGIELIHAIQERHPQIKIIVLSCYKNSEYIKEAMKYNGALDYIFKLELDKEELLHVLEKVKKIIVQDAEKGNVKRACPKEIYVKQILNGERKTEILESPLQIDVSRAFVCICIGVLCSSKKAKMHASVWEEKLQSLKIWISDTFENSLFIYDLLEFQQKYYVYLSVEEITDQQIRDACMKIINTARLYWDFSVGAGISLADSGMEGMVNTYRQAEEAFDHFFLTQKAGIHLFSDYAVSGLQLKAIPEVEILAALSNRDLTVIAARLEEYFCLLEQRGEYRPSRKIKEDCFVLLSLLMRQANDFFENLNMQYETDHFMKNVLESDCLTCLKKVVNGQLECLKSEIEQGELIKANQEIKKALEFIQKHYNRDITLKEIAAYVGMNESYFSYVFKKTVRKNFISYLNEVRIERAKELITDSAASLNLIAEKVGYGNYAYFSKVFKAATGVPPNDYRKQFFLKK